MRIGPELVIKTNSKSQKKKSLPKRAGRRSPCHASWERRSEARKENRRNSQAAAHRRNIDRGYSEWDLAKAARKARRSQT